MADRSVLSILMTACVLAVLAAGAAGADNRTSPNIVFILADDLGIMDVGAYATHLTGRKPGELYYETPNLDRLV